MTFFARMIIPIAPITARTSVFRFSRGFVTAEVSPAASELIPVESISHTEAWMAEMDKKSFLPVFLMIPEAFFNIKRQCFYDKTVQSGVIFLIQVF